MPERIQRKRTKGWRMPPNTVYVGRPSMWGNPFVPGQPAPKWSGLDRRVKDKRDAFVLFRAYAEISPSLIEVAREDLRGKNLACWCPILNVDGCHADVLLEIANGEQAMGIA